MSRQLHIDTIVDHLYKLIQNSSDTQTIELVQGINLKLAKLNSLLQSKEVEPKKEGKLPKSEKASKMETKN